MKNNQSAFVILLLVCAAILIPVLLFVPKEKTEQDDPWAHIPAKLPHTDHTDLMPGPYKTGQEVTQKCLECHEDAAHQVMQTAHWTWESPPVELEGRETPVVLGKKHAINNFCIGIRSNWPPCTACHAGYGWVDESFDFTNSENVDCLVCHDRSKQYVKGNGGIPPQDVDLTVVAQSVGEPSRDNCGGCHFKGGGGNAVKHGDLDGSLYYPTERIDIHMGKHDFLCTDCHTSVDHQMKGRSISVSVDNTNQVYCSDCHDDNLHKDVRINAHLDAVACQTCHIPQAAIKTATKMHWDWAEAGQDLPEDPHEYLKIKGRFVYEKNITPDYFWYNGLADHYVFGDRMDPNEVTLLNEPKGDVHDKNAKIWPFKIHTATQVYDKNYNYLLQPKTFGKGGFWTEFDWQRAVTLGSKAVGMEYSGEYGFVNTAMFWPLTHMVAPKEDAMQCIDCHGDSQQRMNWQALGYEGDPMVSGGRQNL